MPETREWPASLRRAAKVLLSVIYLGCAGAGLHVSLPLGGVHGSWWAFALGVGACLAGGYAWVMMMIERWLREHVAAWVLGIVLGCYGAVDTLRLLFGEGADVGGTLLAWVSCASVGLRIVHLRATKDRWYIVRTAVTVARAART